MNSLLSVIPISATPILGNGSFWLPPPDSTTAPAVDRVFYMILAVCAIFFFLVVATMVAFVIRYRQRPGYTPEKSPSHSNLLEITWTIIPVFIVAYIFYAGFTAYMEMQTAPQNPYEVIVTAKKWSWDFAYPNGHHDTDLHVPVNEPIKLIMSSDDVIHSLSIPAFRVKMDCVPGRYTYAWFQGTKAGTYDLYCTEYCGDSHYDMQANVVVHESGGFEAWLEDAANAWKSLPPEKAGEDFFMRRCNTCHSVDGTAKTGPTVQGIFGATHKLRGGGSVKVDENYIRDSIMDPQKQIRDGYNPVMPTFKGVLSDEQITAIIAYIKSLKK